jgi:hypothetical protein
MVSLQMSMVSSLTVVCNTSLCCDQSSLELKITGSTPLNRTTNSLDTLVSKHSRMSRPPLQSSII